MNIIVMGCGKIGEEILSSLVAEGHDVTAIDIKEDVIAEITNTYDVMSVCGNGTDYAVLDEANVGRAEMFIAVTNSDEVNMLSCFIARRMGVHNTVARVRNPEYNDETLGFLRQNLGISMAINPERLSAQELFDILKIPSAVKIDTFSSRNVQMIEMRLKPDSILNGIKLADFRSKCKSNVLVCAVQRGNNVYIPDGNFELKGGDKVGITGTKAEILKMLKSLGVIQKQAKNVMIVGASKTAYYLSAMLLRIGTSVKIIDKDRDVCRDICDKFPKAVVIHGDGAKQELLIEEGLKSLDAFVALTGIDEQNILISVSASFNGVPKVISKINRNEYIPMAEKLGMESIISPREIVSNKIVRYARALENSLGSNVETLYKLMDGNVEALEFNVKADCKFLNIPLKDLLLKSNTIIAGIARGRKPITPTGDDVFMAGDRVIVIAAANRRLRDFSDIIK
ncbi:MAG: Trk system potassium transporter TrkA [Clostridia bacterium]|nr:Trk system potassium transporter TrkA [Clostridia bacterium]